MIRLIGYFFGLGTVLYLGVAMLASAYLGEVTRDLPDYQVLAKYSPPVMTRVHADDGSLIAEYAHERRLFLPIQAIPRSRQGGLPVGRRQELLPACRRRFPGPGSRHRGQCAEHGIGPPSGWRFHDHPAGRQELPSDIRPDDRPQGQEAILAFRIEQAYSKDRILELYLNEIFFGLNSYGLASASLTYFNKPVTELTIAEAAYLAALPKAPSNYNPFRHHDAAMERRNWVVDRMVENGYVTKEDGDKAKTSDLGVNPKKASSFLFASDYFASEVRRQLTEKYGQEALFEGGLSVRTSLDPAFQLYAARRCRMA